MKLVPFITVAVLASMFPCFAVVNLEGKVLRLDSVPKQGVAVSLSGTTLSDTTNAAGEWSLVEAASGIARRAVPTLPVSSHLVLRNGWIQISLAGRDVFGRVVSGAMKSTPATSFAAAGRSSATGGFDTLVYSWNGKTILRDTIARDSLVRKEIVRHFDTTVNPAITHGYLIDAQNHLYRTVQIGTQTWMAENLNYAVDSSWCYDDSTDSCSKYGRLYKWAAVMKLSDSCNRATCASQVQSKHQGVCPMGWHVPSDSEWTPLMNYVGGVNTAGKRLKSISGWSSNGFSGNGTDTYGFRALPAGYRYYDDSFSYVGSFASFWSSSEYDADYAWRRNLVSGHDDLYRNVSEKVGYSVRCLKD